MSDKIYKEKILKWLDDDIREAERAANQHSMNDNEAAAEIERAKLEAFRTIEYEVRSPRFDVESELFSGEELASCWTESERSSQAGEKYGFANFINGIRNERELCELNPIEHGVLDDDENDDE